MPFRFPLRNLRNCRSSAGAVACVPPWREGNPAGLGVAARYVHKAWILDLRGTIENQFTCINWQFWSFVGLIHFLLHCAFSAQSSLYTDVGAGEGKPLVMSEAAEGCLPSSPFRHELLSVVLHCILLRSAFWSSSVALNCAPPTMLDVWPDLQAKGVRQIKTVLFLNSLLACSPTLSGGTWTNAVPLAWSFIVYTDAALTPRLLTFEAGINCPNFFPFWPCFFLLISSEIVWNDKVDLPVRFLEDHK